MGETIDIDEPPDLLFRHACDLGFEGIVAKRADAPYRSGRAQSWIKAKCVRRLVPRGALDDPPLRCHGELWRGR